VEAAGKNYNIPEELPRQRRRRVTSNASKYLKYKHL
jgi:hypothetical protein